MLKHESASLVGTFGALALPKYCTYNIISPYISYMSGVSVFNTCPDQEPVEPAVAARPGPPPVESLLATLSKQLPPLAPVKQQQVILPSHWSILWILPSDWSISL